MFPLSPGRCPLNIPKRNGVNQFRDAEDFILRNNLAKGNFSSKGNRKYLIGLTIQEEMSS